MTAKTYEIAFKLAGKLSNDFSKTFMAANAAVQGFNSQLVDLNRQAANVDKVVRLRKETGEAARTYLQAKQKVAEMGRAMSATQQPTQKMITDFNKAKSAVDRAKTSLEKKRLALKEVETAAGTTGVKLKTLIARQNELTASADKARIAQQKQAAAIERVQKTWGKVKENAGYAAISGAGVGAGIMSSVKTAMNFEDQEAELRKFSDEYKDIFAGIQNLTLSYGKTAEDMTNMAAAALQAGIAKNSKDVLNIIEAQTQAAVAFSMTGEEVGDAWADIQSKMGLDVGKTKDVFDIINKLGNETSASSADIINVLQRQGGTLKGLTALSAEQIAALAGAFRSAAPSSEVAATSMATFFGRLSNGANATKAQQKAFSRLGLSSVQLSEQLTGSSESAEEAIKLVLERINQLPASEQGGVIGQLFGTEAGIKSAVATLAKQSKMLDGNLEAVADKSNYAGSMLAEYKSRADTTSEALKIASNSVTKLKEAIGVVLLPYVRKAAEEFTAFTPKILQWIQQNQGLVTTLAKVGALIGGITVAAVPLAIAVKTLTFYWNLMKLAGTGLALVFQKQTYAIIANKVALAAQKVALIVSKTAMLAWRASCILTTGAIKLLTGVVKLLGVGLRFLCTNPIGLAITAFASLVAAGVYVYKNWDTIIAKVSELWGKFKEFLGNIKTEFVAGWNSAWESVKSVFASVFDSLIGIAKSPINAIISMINSLIGGINKLGSVDIMGKKIGVNIPKIPQLAEGGIATRSTLANIGEGREPEAVLPLSKLKSMIGGGTGGSISVNFAPTINVSGAGGSAYAEVEKGLKEDQKNLKKELEKLMQNQRRLSYA